MSDARYHIRFRDDAAGEELGLLLTATPQLGFTRRLINPYAAKTGMGQTKDADLTEWSLVSWRDWRGGRGQEELEDATAFYDAWNVETRIEGQVTLGPLPQNPTGTYPRYEPGNNTWYECGWPGPEMQTVGDDTVPPPENQSGGLDIYDGYKAAQVFRMRLYRAWLKSVEVRVKKYAGTTAALRVSIYTTNPAVYKPGILLGYKDVPAASVTTAWGWVTATFDTPILCDQPTQGWCFWIVVSSTATSETNGYNWSVGIGNLYGQFGWLRRDRNRGLWNIYADWNGTFKAHWSKVAREMSFVAPAGGMSCGVVQLYCQVTSDLGSFYVRLYDDSGGNPNTLLRSVTVTPTVSGWYEATFASAQSLTEGATYHIVVEPVAERSQPVNYNQMWRWGGNSAGGYATGAAKRRLDAGGWTAVTEDMYFRINREELDGNPIAFARYKDKWYTAAGDTIYEWDSGVGLWAISDHVHTKNVTALEVWGGYLWAARGSSNIVRKFNGSNWANVIGVYAKLLRAGGGYLHRTDGTAGNEYKLYYTVDGSTWSDAIDIGNGDHVVTGMAWYRDMLVCATATRLWGVAADLAYPLLDWSAQEDANNGAAMVAWSRTGCLYIPLRFGLYRWNGDSMTAIGPEQGMGLPATRAGYVSAMCGTNNWLYVAVNAGATGTSSILAYSGMGGWHELQRVEKVNQAIQSLGFEVISSPSRLWFGIGKESRYLMLPDYSDNPYQWEGYEFNTHGELETSWVGSELLEVVKDLHEVVVRGEDLSSGQKVKVYYEVDRSGAWTYLGEVTGGPRQELAFEASTFGKRTIGDDSTTATIELASGHTTEGMAAGDWIRVNGEVRQIASITDSDTFVLETALSAAPVADDVVYASRSAGREFRFKVLLETTDKTKTPKLKALFVRYQCNVLDRFVYQLNVRIEDGMVDLAGNPYPHTAADLRVALDAWAKRACQFLLVDPDGVEHLVKVVSVGEGGYRQEEGALPARYASTYSMNLVEVG